MGWEKKECWRLTDLSSEVTLGLVLFQVKGGGGGGVVKHLKLSALSGGTRRAYWTWQEILSINVIN